MDFWASKKENKMTCKCRLYQDEGYYECSLGVSHTGKHKSFVDNAHRRYSVSWDRDDRKDIIVTQKIIDGSNMGECISLINDKLKKYNSRVIQTSLKDSVSITYYIVCEKVSGFSYDEIWEIEMELLDIIKDNLNIYDLEFGCRIVLDMEYSYD